jgi:hypothetical protein
LDYKQTGKAGRKVALLIISALLLLVLLAACASDATPTQAPPPTTAPAPLAPATATPGNSPTVLATTAPGGITSASPTASSGATPASAPGPTPTPASSRNFEHVFIIVLENADYKRAIAQPYMAGLANQGAFLDNFYAETHPSYPNYLALVAGSTFGINSDGQTDLAKTSLVDLMEAKGISWKSYAEQYPTSPACFKGVSRGGYVRKHEPFLSFTNVQNDPTRCAKIVPATQLQKDLDAKSLPQYSLYVPDLNNDGHDTGVGFAAKWLQGFLTPLMKTPAFSQKNLVVITFDEGDEGGSNQIYTLLLGDTVKAGLRDNTKYNHYSLLRTVEDNFELGNLGREDATATPIKGVWNNPVR